MRAPPLDLSDVISRMRARYPEAVAICYDAEAMARTGEPRIGQLPEHVFDWPDGVRLIVSRERHAGYGIGVHVSASFPPTSQFARALAECQRPWKRFLEIAEHRFREISGHDGRAELVGVSDTKGVPHWMFWDERRH
jgi:hypothetical protein